MATIRRLSDPDVRSIFESLHHGKPPPEHLQFSIVPVGPTGLGLSPPSFEFEDGLYVLLSPQRKKSLHPDFSTVPSHLTHLCTTDVYPEVCPWSLSGPQFPKPTAIQQRYCYPKGKEDYSSKKGGALWTMYGADGKEDKKFRLLHVYHSAKRSANRGGGKKTPSRGAVSDDSYSPPARKRQKRGKSKANGVSTPSLMTPKANKRGNSIHRGINAPGTTVSNSPASFSSPASLETLPPLPPPHCHFSPATRRSHSTEDMDTDDAPMPPISNSSSNLNSNGSLFAFANPSWDDDGLSSHNFYPVGPYEVRQSGSFGFGSYQGAPANSMGPPHPSHGAAFANMTGIHRGPVAAHHPRHASQQQYGNHPPLMHHSHEQLDHLYYSQPLLSLPLTTNPSYDMGISPTLSSTDNQTSSPDVQSFAHHLENLHKQICDKIQAAPTGDQAALLSIFTSWAGHVAQEPLIDNAASSSSSSTATASTEATIGVKTETSTTAATTQNKQK